jgi:hypothetical protein
MARATGPGTGAGGTAEAGLAGLTEVASADAASDSTAVTDHLDIH